MTDAMATPLRDVITIPERVNQGDFVMRLAEGVGAASTLTEYVVTEQLAGAFDQALGIVRDSLRDGRSRAAYLHGSFGSGKSHFMAVLWALLRNDPQARALPGLAEVVARYDGLLSGSRLLEVTYHMLGATSVEEAVLGGYLRRVREVHPDAPLPNVHRSDRLIEDARGLLAQMGDEAFFARMGSADEGWGDLGAAWDRASFEAAAASDPGSDERRRLVSDLVTTYFTAVTEGSEYRDFDEGLAEMSRHSKSLGYDGVVLFLDELVLWLASRSSDADFVRREGSKVLKLVESAAHARPVPLISFVARQRDLRDFLGQHLPGAEQYAFAESLKHSDDRFEVVPLEDRNLPVIAERRLLAPRDDAGRELMDSALAVVQARRDVMDVLLSGGQADGSTAGQDLAAFRRTYPFSPAFMGALLSLSNVLQRERTALKVMREILVEQRGELLVSDVIPVGDLFDAVVETGTESVLGPLREKVESARRLYREKLRPQLLARHELTAASPAEIAALPRTHAFRTDDRLVKTLLLSAIVPETDALKGLTAGRLAALNHGTINAPIPGEERSTVITTLRALSEQVAEINVGEGVDPLVTVVLTRVDYASVLTAARSADSEGARRRVVRRLVWQALGLTVDDGMYGSQQVPLLWRGRKVVVDLAYGNVRDTGELGDDAVRADGDRWKVVVDFPFDATGYSSQDDFARVEDLVARGVESTTVFWLPAFLTQARLDDLGNLTVMEEVLSSSARFDQYAASLAPGDRAEARTLIEQQRNALREKLVDVIKQAYGAAPRRDADVDTSLSRDAVFASLQPGFVPHTPAGSDLHQVFRGLVEQMEAFSFPDRPDLGPDEVKPAMARTVLAYAQRAVDDEAGRVDGVDTRDRAALRRLANGLELGQMLENHYLLDASTLPWATRFRQAAAAAGHDPGSYRVEDLLSWIDQPRPRGLERVLASLVVQVFALQQGLAWFYNGGPASAPELTASSLVGYELRTTSLPDADVWAAARQRAMDLFGVNPGQARNVRTLGALATEVQQKARAARESVADTARQLVARADVLGLDPAATSGRLATARAVADLMERLSSATDDLGVATVLHAAVLPADDVTAAKAISSAGEVSRALAGANWTLLQALPTVSGVQQERAADVLARLRDTAGHEEFAAPLAPALQSAEAEATSILVTPDDDEQSRREREERIRREMEDRLRGEREQRAREDEERRAGEERERAERERQVRDRLDRGGPLPTSGSVSLASADDVVQALDRLRLIDIPAGSHLRVSWTVEPQPAAGGDVQE